MSYTIVDIELNGPLPRLEPRPDQEGLALLVRRDARPIGWLLHRLHSPECLSPLELSRLIADRLRIDLIQDALCTELTPSSEPMPSSVAVCVLADGRPPALEATVESLTQLGLTRIIVAETGDESSPGAARRRLLQMADEDYVVLLEAGTVVDRDWRAGLNDALAQPGAGIVSGPLLPRELQTDAQIAFVRRGGEFHGFRARGWTGDPLSGPPLDPAELRIPWSLNNVVVDRRLLLALDALDSPAATAYRVLRSGAAVLYAPRMLALHSPPRERAALRRRHAAWGRSLTAAAAAAYSGAPESRPELLSLAVRWAAFQASEMARARRGNRDAGLIGAELLGALVALPAALRRAAPASAEDGHRTREDPFAPARIVHVDLASNQSLDWPAQEPTFVVAWWREVPLGHLFLPAGDAADPTVRRARVAEAIAPAVGERLFGRGFERVAPNRFRPAPPPPPALEHMLAATAPLRRLEKVPPESGPRTERLSVSVIVCTQRRPDDLRRSLGSLRELTSPPLEIVVVDNDPDSPSAAGVAASFPDVVYVHEPRSGLSIARNAGIRAAQGAIIAFVDDDVVVHRRWLDALARAFSDPRASAVTGLVLPAELDSTAQVIFEKGMGQAGRGHRKIIFDQSFFTPQLRTGPPVWTIGAGANMAFRREVFDWVGLFDERLGAGAAGCSEDSELWYRLLAAGGECHYLPEAVVFHRHRVDRDQLRRQVHDYVRGHVAALFLQYGESGHSGNLWRGLVTVPLHLLRRTFREVTVVPPARTGTITAELSGYLAGLRHFRFALSPPAGPRVATADRSPRWRIPRSPAPEPGGQDAGAPQAGPAALRAPR